MNIKNEADSEFYRNLLQAYIDSANDGIFVLCDEMKFHVANPLLETWLGSSEKALTEHNRRLPITHFIGLEDSILTFRHHFSKVLKGLPTRFECLIHPPHSDERWVEISLSRVNLEDGDLFIGVARDITKNKSLMELMEHQATHDYLTGLTNRQTFEQRLENLVADANTQHHEHALLYMDLDQFKLINDTCGHVAGDALLRDLTAIIRNKVRGNDLLARIGGDEFGLLLENCPIEKAMEIAESQRESINNFRFSWQERIFDIGVSIGVVAITAHSTNAATVLSEADAACFVAKEKGRNRVQLFIGSQEFLQVREEMNWVSRITSALEEDRFQLYFQSILPLDVNLQTIPHYEVLLRLIDERGQTIPPAQFMPSAEKYHMMPLIDRWVISSLFKTNADLWQNLFQEDNSKEMDGAWAINLSGASINDDSFLPFLMEQIAKNRIPPQILCFEITETVAIENLGRATEFIRQMKSIGCHFALDDFGSGMSSFAYLRNLPVDFLKIDGSLVKNIVHDPVSHVMVEAIQKIGHAMEIRTVAEFVENQEILEKLRNIGVDYAQGYGIHKPEPLTC